MSLGKDLGSLCTLLKGALKAVLQHNKPLGAASGSLAALAVCRAPQSVGWESWGTT